MPLLTLMDSTAVVANPKTATVVDTFGAAPANPPWAGGFGYTVTGGQLQLATTQTAGNTGYPALTTGSLRYDLFDSELVAEVPAVPSVTTTANQQEMSFNNGVGGAGTHVRFVIDHSAGTLAMQNWTGYGNAAGQSSISSITYSQTTHRWLKIKYVTGTSTGTFETSPDGVTWTVRGNFVSQSWMNAGQIYLGANATGAGTGTFYFDNINSVPTTTPVTSTSASAWGVRAAVASTAAETWAVRYAATGTSASTWNVRAAVSAVAAEQWAVRTSVSASAAESWGVRAAVASTAAETWAVRYAATGTSASAWNVRTVVSASAVETWAVRSGVGQSSTQTWAVRTIVAASAAEAWAVRTSTSATNSQSWAVRAPVSATAPEAWAVRARVTGSAAESWAVRAPVTSSAAEQWAVRAAVTSSAGEQWAVRTTVAAATRLEQWAVRAAVTASAAEAWNVASAITSVTGTAAESWAVRARVTGSAAETWNVRAAITASVGENWAVRSTISRAAAENWAVRTVVAAATRIETWAVRAAVTATKATTWNVSASQPVTSTIATAWAVRGLVEATRADQYNVLTPVVITRSDAWTVRTPVTSAVSTSWTTVGRVTASVSSSWKVFIYGAGEVVVTRSDTWKVLMAVDVTRSDAYTVSELVLLTASQVRRSVTRTLQRELPSKLFGISRETGIALPSVVTWAREGSFDRVAEEQTPAIYVVANSATLMSQDTVRQNDTVDINVKVFAVVTGRDETETSDRLAAYIAGIRYALRQDQKLDGFAISSSNWVERYDEAPNRQRTIASGSIALTYRTLIPTYIPPTLLAVDDPNRPIQITQILLDLQKVPL